MDSIIAHLKDSIPGGASSQTGTEAAEIYRFAVCGTACMSKRMLVHWLHMF
jgi:hypothetical protein